MSSERTEEFSGTPATSSRQPPNDGRDAESGGDHGRSADAACQEVTILVRGETVSDPRPTSSSKDSPSKDSPFEDSSPKDSQAKNSQAKDSQTQDPQPKDAPPKEKAKSPRKEVSEAKVKMQSRLPALDDDVDTGVQKEQVVVRDGKADLAFTGALLASAAPPSAPKGQWQEYRIYETNGGKHVFSKVSRSVFAEEQDTHEAEVFDPSPSSVPSQLLRGARDLARSRPMTWMDAAVAFFGYDPLAKDLYRKLSGQFEEHIS
jgi:hypothetical protein